MSEATAPANANISQLWWVQVRGQAYGPYSLTQMRGFVEEGRVRPTTLVSDKPDSGWAEARRIDAIIPNMRAELSTRQTSSAEAANIFVFAEIRSGAWTRFVAALESLGILCDLAPGLWLVRTRHSAGVLRNTLSQTLETGDKFAVMDATRDRFAWYNLGPEVDVRIGMVWNGPAREEKKLPA